MSEAERTKRLGDAMQDLKDMGVKIAPPVSVTTAK